MMLPIPVPMPVAQGIIYGITRALGEVWSRVAGNKVTIKAEKDLKERQFWLQELHLDLEGQSLAFEKAKFSAQMLLDREKQQDQLEFERERLRQQLTLEREKMHAHAVERVQEIQLSAELKQIYEHHPIRLTPRTFQRNYAKDRIPLHIMLVPPKGPGGVDEMRNLLPEIEDDLLAFVQEHYHAASSSHPGKLLTETWIPGRPCGSSAVQGLFGLLEGVPMLIVEAVSLTSGLSLRIGFWGLEQDDSSYARIGTIPWAALAIDPTRIPLNPPDDDAVARIESLIAAERLLPWYRLIFATTLDQFHLLQSGAKPLVPRLLPAILAGSQANSEHFEPLVASTLEAYRQIYAAFAIAHGVLAPDLMLDLAEALAGAERPAEARECVNDALNALLAFRKGPIAGETIASIELFAKPADASILERASDLFKKIGETSSGERLSLLARAQRLRLGKIRKWTSGQIFRDLDFAWCPEMVVIPAGKFLMGSPVNELGRYRWEDPQHVVYIEDLFALGRYPVTFDEFDEFVSASGYDYRPDDAGRGRGRRPVIKVCWEDAQAYCAWLSERTEFIYRLPSEAEWEYACRAGTTTSYFFGNNITTDQVNFSGWNDDRSAQNGTFRRTTLPVDEFAPNTFGLFQMHGNVSEWCADPWHEDYNGAPQNGRVWEEDGDLSHRVFRGGGYEDDASEVRSAARNSFFPDKRGHAGFGFRIVRVIS